MQAAHLAIHARCPRHPQPPEHLELGRSQPGKYTQTSKASCPGHDKTGGVSLLLLYTAADDHISSLCTSAIPYMMEGERQMERLPPGFRFFPTDEELITYYLARKAMDASFTSAAIRDVDLYKSEPWELPCKAAATTGGGGGGGDQQCYFFCMRGSRYPSGARARRATAGGYWKSTGKDKGVYCSRGGRLIGTKKTLVFYGGRAPRGEKTSWVMHEYTLGQRSPCSSFLRGAQSEWVICKVFMKKPASDHSHRKLEMELEQEEAAVHGHTSPAGHLLPMVPDGCDGGEEEEAPPVHFDPWRTNCHPGEEEHTVHREELPLIMNRSRCVSPSWLLHDDHQLGAYCSTWRTVMQLQHSSAPDDLPELLEYDDGHDLPKRRSDISWDTGLTGGEAQLSPASVGSLHLDEPYWNFGF